MWSGVPEKETNTKKGRAQTREKEIEPLDPAILDLLPRLLDSLVYELLICYLENGRIWTNTFLIFLLLLSINTSPNYKKSSKVILISTIFPRHCEIGLRFKSQFCFSCAVWSWKSFRPYDNEHIIPSHKWQPFSRFMNWILVKFHLNHNYSNYHIVFTVIDV